MKRNFFLSIIVSFFVLGCSTDESNEPVSIPSSINSKEETDFFINRNNSVDIILTGAFNKGNEGLVVVEKGWVYSVQPMPKIENGDLSIEATGVREISGTISQLSKNSIYYVRGYLKRNNGTYSYGNEIVVNTNFDASGTRGISLEIITPSVTDIQSNEFTIKIKVTDIKKESPIEIGFEYSLSPNFTNAVFVPEANIIGNVSETIYHEQAQNVQSTTTYYVRPYAKYRDGYITTGGTSFVTITTPN